MKIDDKVKVKIKSLTYGGQALAIVDGKVLFVDEGFPDEELEVQITRAKGNFAQGVCTQVLVANRGKSPCAYSNECGGCSWLELHYANQLRWKESFIHDALSRIGGFKELPSLTMQAAKEQFFYRNRIQLRGQILTTGKVQVGYFKKGTREQVAVNTCQIADPALNKIIEYLASMELAKIKPQKFRLELQVLPAAQEQDNPCILAVLYPIEKWSPENREAKALGPLIAKLRQHPSMLWAGFAYEVKEQIFSFERWQGIEYLTIPGIFQQVNVAGNHILRQWIKDRVEKLAPTRVLDLFCGSGNLSLGLATAGRSVLGVEASGAAIYCARKTVEKNKLVGMNYRCLDVAKFLTASLARKETYDLIILDPPRAGLKDLVEKIMELDAKAILIAACDPMTLARDLKILATKYRIEEVTGFDFFPNTYHIETGVMLTNRS